MANQIGSTGAEAFRNNLMNKKGMNGLVRTFKQNSTLRHLSVNFNNQQVCATLAGIVKRNRIKSWMTGLMNARLVAQAQRIEHCLLGRLPVEVSGIINNFTEGANHYSFFIAHIDKQPTAGRFG